MRIADYKTPDLKNMKKLIPEKLDEILDSHKKWLDSEGKEGQKATLSHYDLTDMYLFEANLSEADLSYSKLHGINFAWANLGRAHFFKADLTGADLFAANAQGADFSHADLKGAFLLGTQLQGARLHHANLQGVSLHNADLRGADLTGVKGLNEEQLKKASTDKTTVLPDYIQMDSA